MAQWTGSGWAVCEGTSDRNEAIKWKLCSNFIEARKAGSNSMGFQGCLFATTLDSCAPTISSLLSSILAPDKCL